MNLGIFSDIHGNLPALKVILEKFKEENCDVIYCLGDIIAIGPFPRECAELLLSLPNVRFVMGNHEEYFVKGITNSVFASMSEDEKEHQAWVSSSLSDDLKETIHNFPYQINENIEGFQISFIHYALNDKENPKTFKSFEKNITAQNMDILFQEVNAEIIFFGHEHNPCNIKGKKHYINVGSSGCTKDNITHCTIVEFKDKTYKVQVYEMDYNKHTVIKALYEKNVPQREFLQKVFF